MKLSKEVNKIFAKVIQKYDCFEIWHKEATTHFTLVKPEAKLDLLLHLDKYWEPSGGTVYLDLNVGVHWDFLDYNGHNPERLSWRPIYLSERSWEVHSADDLMAFEIKLDQLFSSELIPVIHNIDSKQGWYQWALANEEPVPFGVHLELAGKKETQKRVKEWFAKQPRRIEDQVNWLVKHQIIPQALAEKMNATSMQLKNKYDERLPEILQALEAVMEES